MHRTTCRRATEPLKTASSTSGRVAFESSKGFRKAIEPSYQGELVAVPKSTPLDATVECGFLGTNSRVKKGQKGGFSYVESFVG